jgi:hypothetical protein
VPATPPSSAAREATFAERDSACVAAAAASAPRERNTEKVTRGAVDRAWRALVNAIEVKGVVAADLPPSKQRLISEASGARASGDLGKAMDAIEQAAGAVDAVTVDGDFISRKVRRVNGLQKKGRVDVKVREEVAHLLQDVTRAYSDGRFLEANRVLNNIELLTQKASDKP